MSGDRDSGGDGAPDGGDTADDGVDIRQDAGGDADHAVTGETPRQAAASGTAGERARGVVASLTREEKFVAGAFGIVFLYLVYSLASGAIKWNYLLFLLSLAGMYMLLSMGLNVQWGYTGLINFSVAAFFGIGAYATMLLSSPGSPLVDSEAFLVTWPIAGLVLALLAGGALAVLIGIPTLSLREDYLAIASIGLAEVVRLVILNQRDWTNGSAGIPGLPRFFAEWPVVGDLVAGVDEMLLNLLTVIVFIGVVWLFLRRIHQSPWGRVQRIIRADEDLAEALGKDTYSFRMQSFVIGSAIMALAGVFFVHLQNFVSPSALLPIQTFYVWIAVILGGTGSNRGAMVGGFLIITIVEGTRFLPSSIPIEAGPLRLLLVGVLIIGVMYFRPQGVLPPQRELIYPGVDGGDHNE